PEAHFHNVSVKPTEMQKDMVSELSERADRVRNKMVDASVDNMLKITNDGRKLALDQRLINEMLPDDESSKVSACANNIFEIWDSKKDDALAQLVFCDLSTPHYDDSFNVYDDIKKKLIVKGVPEEEIAYIHDADNENQKKELFTKVRKGQVRILLGSTQKMGAGTNVQDKLIALHHLDCPWRPADLQQRNGRIVRQGNKNPEIDIYSYVTENTFDAYLYQLVENKQRFIGQIMTSKSPVRSAEDIDETALNYAEIKALATGNPYIKEKMDLDIAVSRLKLLKSNYLSQKYSLEDSIAKTFPQQIKYNEERIAGYKSDIARLSENFKPNAGGFCPMSVKGVNYTEKAEAGKAILEACKAMSSPDAVPLGEYRGFSMSLSFDSFNRTYQITLHHTLSHTVALGTDTHGNITRLDNVLEGFENKMKACAEILDNVHSQLESAKVEVEKPFAHEEELKKKTARLDELNSLLNMDEKDNELLGEVPGEDEQEEPKKVVGIER
ncbi:MAG: helicase C-terminal domain-containing protein, partial [Bacteroidaceae bacterium]|nr:helicase C-terminal domain-containing protein [Bacteroidaceae bacterium]